MRNLLKSPSDINRIEYWAATTIFVFAIFFLVSGSLSHGSDHWRYNQGQFNDAHQRYSFFANYFFPTMVRYVMFYVCYLFLTFIIVPPLAKKKNVVLNLIMTFITFDLICLVMGITNTWIHGYMFSDMSQNEVYRELFSEAAVYSLWLLLMFALYNIIKFLAIYLLENSDLIQSKYRVISRDGIYAFIVWMIGLFVLLITGTPVEGVTVLSVCSLAGICLYCYAMYAIIPEAYRNRKSVKDYLRRITVPITLMSLPIFIILIVSVPNHKEEIAFITTFFNILFQFLFTTPLAWYVYKHRITVDYEIKGLETALGQSNADLNFLRSQINPHFLFNVLNTLYGTALQENADRTSEGIQKLGDMMRFMLRENLQEKISLTREIEYLNNYIGLQTLRTQSSPDISISLQIEDHVGTLQIAPMILIPFVENAFKHGISLKEPSYIRISLSTKDDTLYFDISNSTHPKTSNDPERDNNGIGLNNVKQRLRLMYAHKNELSIRESGKEFFVHLTLKLD